MAKKKELKRTLIVDIGTASVSAGYLETSKTGSPLLDFVERVPIGTGTETSRAALLKNTGEALTLLLEKFSKQPPNMVHVVLAAPWHDAHARTISSKTDTPVLITQRTIAKAIQQYKNEKPPVEGNVDVEVAATMVSINGYPTTVQKPVYGSTLSINVYESEIPESIKKQVLTVIEKAFPNSQHTYNTFPLISAVALREVTYATGFVIVDFSGEITEVTFVYDDTVHHLATFPMGYYTIARELSKKNQSEVGDSLSRLALFGREELNEEEVNTMRKNLENVFNTWYESFNKAIIDVSEQIPLPQKMFVISDKDPLQWFVKELRENNRYSFVIEPVNPPIVQNKLELGAHGVYDIFLSLAALFFHTEKKDILGEV